MLATFRNIAVIVITWHVCYLAGGLLAYGAQFMFGVVGDSQRPGTVVLMHLVAGFSVLLLSPLAGVIGAAGIRPKGEVKWVVALGGLFLVNYITSTAMAYPIDDWSVEDFIGIILVGCLLVVGVSFGGSIIRKRAQTAANSRVQPT